MVKFSEDVERMRDCVCWFSGVRLTPNVLLTRFFVLFKESGSPESRVNAVHFLVHKLPERNKEMLDILVKHLTK